MASAWVAIDSTTDPRERARRLAAAHDAVLGGAPPPGDLLRDVIVGSWARSRQAGVDAETGLPPLELDADEAHDRWERHPLAPAIPAVRALLADVGGAAQQVMLFCDADGTLLWIEGEHDVLARAREQRLQPGAVWSETAAGTNAMGTALATGHPLQVFSAEHYSRAVHAWTCSAAPIHDPDTGRVIGVLDLSGELSTAHPHSLAVVTAAARLVDAELRRAADESAARLVEAFGGRVGRGASRADGLADPAGRVLLSARDGLTGRRLAVPVEGGRVALPGGRAAIAEPLPGGRGFLLWREERAAAPGRPAADGPPAFALAALGHDRAHLTIGDATHTLSPRHSELLTLLALRPAGWTAEQLAVELLGDFGKPVSIRAELSRLRRILGPALTAQPYRLTQPPQTDFGALERALDEGRTRDALERLTGGELLPGSDAPTIAEARFRLTTAVREAVMAAGDPDLLRRWITLPAGEDDVHACRALMARCPPADPRHALAAGRLRRLAGAA